MTYDEIKSKGKLLSMDESTEFWQVDGEVYMVYSKEDYRVEKVDK